MQQNHKMLILRNIRYSVQRVLLYLKPTNFQQINRKVSKTPRQGVVVALHLFIGFLVGPQVQCDQFDHAVFFVQKTGTTMENKKTRGNRKKWIENWPDSNLFNAGFWPIRQSKFTSYVPNRVSCRKIHTNCWISKNIGTM